MFRRSKQQESIAQLFEREFALEILKSDRLRVTILIYVLGIAALLGPAFSIILFEDFRNQFNGNFTQFVITFLVIMTTTITCLGLERVAITKVIKDQKPPIPLLQYVSALIETSIASIALIVTAWFLNPIYSLFTPAPFVYGLLIVLSTLRLNFRLCVFTGAVAAVEYWVLSWIFISTTPHTNIEPLLIAVPPHLLKGVLLLLTGIAAGLVKAQVRKRIISSLAMDSWQYSARRFPMAVIVLME